jgi:hypothetical protein
MLGWNLAHDYSPRDMAACFTDGPQGLGGLLWLAQPNNDTNR